MVKSTHNVFDSFSALNVLIIGDVMIDRYLSGLVDRVSPEAPVPVVHLQKRENRLGGAANVALNIRAMGATPYLCSVIGDDENAQHFLDLLPTNDLPTKGILQSRERITTVKTRVMASNQHLLRVDTEDSAPLTEQLRLFLLDRVRDILDTREIGVILFQDYNKGILDQRVISDVILEAIRRDIPTAVDPKFHNFWAYKHVTLFKPNLKEIRAQVPRKVEVNMDSLNEASDYINSKLGNQYTMITLSEKGLYLDTRKQRKIFPTQERSVADVSGAGDTVIGLAALGLAAGMDLHDLAVLANLAGGQVCERVGVVPVDRQQLQQEYKLLLQRQGI